MTIVAAVLSLLIAAVAIASAAGKLTKNPKIIEGITHVGVTESQIPMLAALEVLGGVAVLLGFVVPWLGVAGAVGLTLYFLGAVVFHLRTGDGPDVFAVPLVLALLAAVAAITRVLAT
jgi:uncharacterized membrane protein YphA (DoxX/SURF4 family)